MVGAGFAWWKVGTLWSSQIHTARSPTNERQRENQ